MPLVRPLFFGLLLIVNSASCRNSGGSAVKSLDSNSRPQCTSMNGRGYGDLWSCGSSTCAKQNSDYTNECISSQTPDSASPAPASTAAAGSGAYSGPFNFSIHQGSCNLDGNYPDSASMCSALQVFSSSCPQAAQMYADRGCSGSGSGSQGSAPSNPAPQSGSGGGFWTVACTHGNSSNWNAGPFANQGALCRDMCAKEANMNQQCPTDVRAALTQYGCSPCP